MGKSRLEYQNHPDRLTVPLRRVGDRGEDQWEEISWEEAISLFVEKQKKMMEKYGSKSVCFSVGSGAFGLLTRGSPTRYAALTGATMNRSSGFDYGISKGLEYMFGEPAAGYFLKGGHSYQDAINSELIVLWGSNAAVTRSVDHVPLKRARRNGTKIICIDPTNSETAKLCDEWISIRPGSDGALALALAHQLLKDDLIDKAFLASHTDFPLLINVDSRKAIHERDISSQDGPERVTWCNEQSAVVPLSEAISPALSKRFTVELADGSKCKVATVFELFKDMVDAMSPSTAADITGVDEATIISLAREYARAKPGSIRMGYGVDRWYYSDVTGRAIAALACLTGNIGIAGGGVSLNDGYLFVPVQGRHFYSPEGKAPSYLSLMEIDSAVRSDQPYPIKMECITLGNFYLQAKPDRASVIKDYVSKLEFITVIDHFMTDTARYADLVLPACTIFEKSDIVVDEMLQLQQKVVPAVGQAKSDFEIMALFAEEMGLGHHFNKSEEEYIDDVLQAPSPLLKGVDMARLKQEKVIYPWPDSEPYFGFKDRVFGTPSGRIEFYKEDLIPYGCEMHYFREPIEASPKSPLFQKYPLVLLSSHSRYRIHSTFANLTATKNKEPDPVIRINPGDAEKRGLESGAIAKVYNDRGLMKIKCRIDENIRPGCVVVSEGQWTKQFIEGDPYILTHAQYSPTSENYAHYDVLVEAMPERVVTS
jgi:anaerobic selenocysteine-containing dehydrogenase